MTNQEIIDNACEYFISNSENFLDVIRIRKNELLTYDEDTQLVKFEFNVRLEEILKNKK